MPDNDDTRSTSEKRHQALEAQMKQRQFVQRLKERGERIKNAESTPSKRAAIAPLVGMRAGWDRDLHRYGGDY